MVLGGRAQLEFPGMGGPPRCGGRLFDPPGIE